MSVEWTVERAAAVLLEAETARTDRGPITDEWPALDLDTAYRIQDERLRLKIAEGRRITGVKLGLTSRPKQRRMGIDSPLTAWLTDDMPLPPGAPLVVGDLIHPRVEPEIVFVLGRRLTGPGITAATALRAVSEVTAGLEVIDSRYTDFRFTLPDVVADNASSARYLTGDLRRDPHTLDLAAERCHLKINGTTVDTATGAAVQGHPAEALALAANTLSRRGLSLEPGWTILTGGLTDAIPTTPGDTIEATFTNLGTVTLPCH
ncbi:4-oxalocrotonate decarboxylase [Actinomadura sp. NBRC 104412]|uniref:2-keto-4-pentenoate hydratase n=1 Tax=Actinomadura sp. NBRC 104412 TaxID=3032203 RepID=UPI0024A1D151|nr:fumarylacetoacetate hydrolase family protein [Actinomadura sp. NBRC 104412]GLZ02922.1 4-oxalocrotonate decarboxylase [Actinomadura sp. NBRC 104412]